MFFFTGLQYCFVLVAWNIQYLNLILNYTR